MIKRYVYDKSKIISSFSFGNSLSSTLEIDAADGILLFTPEKRLFSDVNIILITSTIISNNDDVVVVVALDPSSFEYNDVNNYIRG